MISRAWRTLRRRRLLEPAAYLVLALWSLWPLPTRLRTALPLGTESAATVPLLNHWTIWWNADRLAAGGRGYWDAPIFHPSEDVFAFSEPQLTTLLVAPLVWLLGADAAAYNVYLLAALTLNGTAAAALLRRVDVGSLSAFLGGAMVELLPFVHWQLGVLQLVPLFGVIWSIHALCALSERPAVRSALLLGGALGVTFLTCGHYGLFLGLLLPFGGLWLAGRHLLRVRFWVLLGLAAVVAGGLILPVAWKHWQVVRRHDWKRPLQLAERLSLEPGDYTQPAWRPLIDHPRLAEPHRRQHWKLSPGLLKAMLAVLGIVAGLLSRRLRAWTAFCATTLVLALLLSLGPRFQVAGWQPWQWLVEYVPGFALVRNVFRFAVFVQLMTALLATVALSGLVSPRLRQFLAGCLRRIRGRGTERRAEDRGSRIEDRDARSSTLAPRRSAPEPRAQIPDPRPSIPLYGIMLVVGLAAIFEITPPSAKTFALPPRDTLAWVEWLRQQTLAEAVIVHVPIAQGSSVEAYELTTIRMYYQTGHGRRMVNGYSGFFPERYFDLKQTMLGFPDAQSLTVLKDYGVDYCVVDRRVPDGKPVAAGHAARRRLQHVFTDDDAEIDVYRLLGP